MRRLLLLALASLALPAAAAQTGHAVYRPGLTQARIELYSDWGYKTATDIPNLSSNLLELVEEGHADWLDRTLDVFKDGSHDENAQNPISGTSWPWLLQNKHGVFAYEGELWVEEGTNYFFYARSANGEAMVVDGETVVYQGRASAYNNAPEIRRFWLAPKTGWVPFNLWFWSNDGRTGTQNSQWGAQYNTAGWAVDGGPELNYLREIAYNSYTNVWKRFVDPGNGTFLRTATTNRFTTATTSDGRTWNLTFAGVPHAAQLAVFWGPTDGIHDADEWASHIVYPDEVPAGDSSTTVSVSPEANATALRFRLAYANVASTNGLDDVFEEWTEAFPLADTPVVRVDAVRPGFTNVIVSGELASLGRDGADATVTIQIADAADESFAHPMVTNLPAVSAAGPFEVLIQGVETNADYLVRAIATATACATSSVVSFRTARPTPAEATANVVLSKFFEADIAAVVSDWGAGATGAEVWIDVAPDDTFAPDATRTIFLGTLSGHLPRIEVGKVAGLSPDTDYRARVRLRNSWGLESESQPVDLRTSDVPLVFSEPETSSANGWASVSLATNYVAAGTVYSVQLVASSRGFTQSRNWSVPTDEPPFVCSVPASSGQSVHFRFEISWSNGDFSSGDDPIVIEADTMWTSEADYTMTLAEIDAFMMPHPGRPNHYLRPGETVALVPSANDATIAWHTNAVASISEKGILTALEPGATLLYEQDSSGKTNNVLAAVIVLPAEDPAGGIYLHDTFADFAWDDPDEWEMIAPGPQGQGYPDAPGAVVYIVSPADLCYNSSGTIGKDEHPKKAIIPRTITIGYLAVGQLGWIHHNCNDKSTSPWVFSDEAGSDQCLNFKTGDGSASWIRMLGHSYITSRVNFQVPVSMENDLDIDELNRVQDTLGRKNSRSYGLWFERSVDVGTNRLRTVRTHLYPYNFAVGTSGFEHTGWVSFRNDILGSGIIRLEAASLVGLAGCEGNRTASFIGTWDIANGDLNPRINYNYGAAGLNLWGLGLGNAEEMIVRGSWHRATKTWPRGALVRTGYYLYQKWAYNGTDWRAWTNDWQNGLPGRITLDGGDLQIHPQGRFYTSGDGSGQTTEDIAAADAVISSGGVRQNLFKINELIVPAGPMGRLDSKNKGSSNYPNVRTEISNLLIEATAVLSFDLDGNNGAVTNEFFIVEKPVCWTPSDQDQLQFLPYLFANNQIEGTGGNTMETMSSTSIDSPRLAFRNTDTGKISLEDPEETGNGYRRWKKASEDKVLAGGTAYYAMLLDASVTNEFAGENAVVHNLAGYLDMRGGSTLGSPTNAVSATCTLDFGDQPARIFNGNWGEVGTIGCRLAGTAGLVTGGNGTIALAASAEGVSGGVRVAGGTLELLRETVRLANETNVVARGRVAGDVRVEAGSRLVVHGASCIAPGSQLFLNDRDWIPSVGHVRLLDPGRPVYVRELVVAGERMPHGYYGSSDSGAEHADDVHFEGPGKIYAGTLPTLMIFR